MSYLNNYYRAFSELKESLLEDKAHKIYLKKLADADTGNDVYTGKISQRIVDLEWVEKIEETLLYIDKAIREERRFIETIDEIVPIEKARRITTESIRHLAQHTNMIARVEGDEVTPERILNIQREESFAIYENRFLHTLLNKLIVFVDTRFKALSEMDEDSSVRFTMKRDVNLKGLEVNFNTTYSFDSNSKTVSDLEVNVEELSDFDRIKRVRRILSDFMAAPLMRALNGCEPVRPPITRTNLMKKNPNFKNALDLWIYIESYNKLGYEYITNDCSGAMELQFKNDVYESMLIQHFVVQLNTNKKLRNELEQEYIEENRRIEEEKKRLEEERKRLEQEKIEAARQEEIAIREREIAKREAIISDLQAKVSACQEKIDSLENTLKEKEQLIIELKAKISELDEIIKDQNKIINDLNLKITDLNNKLDERENTILRLNAQIAEMIEEIKTQRVLIDEKNTKIADLEKSVSTLEINIQKLEETNAEKDRIISEKISEIASLQEIVTHNKVQIEGLRSELASVINENEANKQKIISVETQLANEKEAHLKDIETERRERFAEINELKEKNQAVIDALNDKYNLELKTLNSQLEDEKESHKADVERLEELRRKEHQEFAERLKNELDQCRRDMQDIMDKRVSEVKAEADKKVKAAEDKVVLIQKEKETEIEKIKKESKDQIKQVKIEASKKIKEAEVTARKKILAAQRLSKTEQGITYSDYRKLIKSINNISLPEQKSGKKILFTDTFCEYVGQIKTEDVRIYPIMFETAGNSYADGDTISPDKMLKLKNDPEKDFKISTVSPLSVLNDLKSSIESGDEIVYIAPSEEISNSINIARLYNELFEQEVIKIIDTRAISSKLGFIFSEILNSDFESLSYDEILDITNNATQNSSVYFVTDTRKEDKKSFGLNKLFKSRTVYTLNPDGDLVQLRKERGDSVNALLKTFEGLDLRGKNVIISQYGYRKNSVDEVVNALRQKHKVANVRIIDASCATLSLFGNKVLSITMY